MLDFGLFDSSYYKVVIVAFYLIGIVCAGYALWRSRTPQGAAAWVVGLVSFPMVFVPFFMIFGRNKFEGYARRRKELDAHAQKEAAEAQALYNEQVDPLQSLVPLNAIAKRASQPGFTSGNKAKLLVNGDECYGALTTQIEKAQKYILFQFYIFRPDKTGKAFADLLIKKAKEGVRVHFLYDEIGTELPRKFVKRMTEAGVDVQSFHTRKNLKTRLQINFRNHRKVVVIDGKICFVGGFNIGDDYLGLYPKIGPWRDTHVMLEGPAALAAQLSFIKDWYWASEKIPDLDWKSDPNRDGDPALVLHTGPADDGEACMLAHTSLVNSAKKRVWIANPYLVPPEGFLNALIIAAISGVEVKLLVPSYTDNKLVMFAAENYQERMLNAGIEVYQYTPGFLHQKVMLIDDSAALVGSVNLDPRSFFINFEISALMTEQKLVRDVEKMLQADFSASHQLTLKEIKRRSKPRLFAARAVSLLSPML